MVYDSLNLYSFVIQLASMYVFSHGPVSNDASIPSENALLRVFDSIIIIIKVI